MTSLKLLLEAANYAPWITFDLFLLDSMATFGTRCWSQLLEKYFLPPLRFTWLPRSIEIPGFHCLLLWKISGRSLVLHLFKLWVLELQLTKCSPLSLYHLLCLLQRLPWIQLLSIWQRFIECIILQAAPLNAYLFPQLSVQMGFPQVSKLNTLKMELIIPILPPLPKILVLQCSWLNKCYQTETLESSLNFRFPLREGNCY